ncbi:MAG: chemotaxis protein CheD [Thermoplasmata archaeon]|nr:chemotaxis protein CheD [Thermoplasmata archaeon]
MTDAQLIGIAQYAVARTPGKLCCLGLGSCVAVFLYDPTAKIGGVVHILLPKAPNGHSSDAKYADTGIRLLLDQLASKGADRRRIRAKLIGGARMFKELDLTMSDIGKENIAECRRTLTELGIRVVAEEVEGDRGRSAYFSMEDGMATIRTAFSQDRRI